MLRIEKLLGETSTVLKLSGRLQEENLPMLRAEIEKCEHPPKLDLNDVNLSDRPSVRFLIESEAQGVRLVNSFLFIREWIARERRRPFPPPKSE
jgi:hypothetical protein